MDAVSDIQENGKMEPLEKIREALKQPGKTQSGLASALGIWPSAVTAMLDGKRQLKVKEIAPAFEYLEIDQQNLATVKGKTSPRETDLERKRNPDMVGNPAQKTPFAIIPGDALIGERDLPVYATAQGGRGAIVLSNEPVDWVVRPDPLLRVKDGYGVLVTEDSMAPEFRSGDIALVNPHLAPRAGDTCVFRSHGEDGTVAACIKFLRRSNADNWLVSEWDSGDGSRRDFTLKRSEWQICHVTVGNYKRR